jgi:hypothetical protein
MTEKQRESIRSFFILSPHSTIFVCDEISGLKPFYQIGWDSRLERRFFPFLETVFLFPENRPAAEELAKMRHNGFKGDVVQCGKASANDPEEILTLSAWNGKHSKQIHFDFNTSGWKLQIDGSTAIDDQAVREWSVRSVGSEWKKVSTGSDSFYPVKIWKSRGVFTLFGYRFYFHDRKMFLLAGGDSCQDVLYFLKSESLQILDYRIGGGKKRELDDGTVVETAPGGLRFGLKGSKLTVTTGQSAPVSTETGCVFFLGEPGLYRFPDYPGDFCPVREGIPYLFNDKPYHGGHPLQGYFIHPLQNLKKLFLPSSRKVVQELLKLTGEFSRIKTPEAAKKLSSAFSKTLTRLFRAEKKNPWSPLEFLTRNLQSALSFEGDTGLSVSQGINWVRILSLWDKRFKGGAPLLPLTAEVYPAVSGFTVLYNLEDTDFSHEDLKKINYYFGRLDTRKRVNGKFFDEEVSLLEMVLSLYIGAVTPVRRDRVIKMINSRSVSGTTEVQNLYPRNKIIPAAAETDEEKKKKKKPEDEDILISTGKKKEGSAKKTGFPLWIPIVLVVLLLVILAILFLFRGCENLNWPGLGKGGTEQGGTNGGSDGADAGNGNTDGVSDTNGTGTENDVSGTGQTGSENDTVSSIGDDTLTEMENQDLIQTDGNGNVKPGNQFYKEYGEGAESRVYFQVEGFPVTIWDVYLVSNQIAIENGFKDLTRKKPAGGDEPSLIYKGMVFDLPDGQKYTVKMADSIWRIAEAYIERRVKEDSAAWKEILQRINDVNLSSQEKSQWREKARKLGENSPCLAFRKKVEEELGK